MYCEPAITPSVGFNGCGILWHTKALNAFQLVASGQQLELWSLTSGLSVQKLIAEACVETISTPSKPCWPLAHCWASLLQLLQVQAEACDVPCPFVPWLAPFLGQSRDPWREPMKAHSSILLRRQQNREVQKIPMIATLYHIHILRNNSMIHFVDLSIWSAWEPTGGNPRHVENMWIRPQLFFWCFFKFHPILMLFLGGHASRQSMVVPRQSIAVPRQSIAVPRMRHGRVTVP